jgi:hypothetical protein
MLAFFTGTYSAIFTVVTVVLVLVAYVLAGT